MKFCSLFSGSSGNCLFVQKNNTRLLIDAGLSGKKIETAIRDIDERPEKLDGILVTHEHRDHIQGIGILSRRYKLPVYVNPLTWEAMKCNIGRVENVIFFENKTSFDIGDLEISAFNISHDAADPVGFVFDDGTHKIGIATDTGIVTESIFDNMKDCQMAIIESNHDEGMVESGSYPYPLKRRILSHHGHLSNHAAADFACRLLEEGKVKHILLAHLSEQNNYPFLANQTTKMALLAHGGYEGISLETAPRNQCSHIYQL